MKKIDSLATDYWIINTDKIYKEDLHISGPVMDAYKSGFEEAKRLLINKYWDNVNKPFGTVRSALQSVGEEEEISTEKENDK